MAPRRLEAPDISLPHTKVRYKRSIKGTGKRGSVEGKGILPQQCFCRMQRQRQSAGVILTADVELLGIAIISGFEGVGALYCN
jgi:hypothetical protein